MQKIPLINKAKQVIDFAFVDDEDYKELSKYSWHRMKIGYASRKTRLAEGKQGDTVYMHRFITKAPKGKVVDHKNNNPLDNRRSNLRVCTQSQNLMNQGKQKKRNKSGYKGVCWSTNARKWLVQIGVNKKRIYLGFFTDKMKAVRAYDEATIKYHGAFARPNLIKFT